MSWSAGVMRYTKVPSSLSSETKTARMVADKLKAWGYAVTEGVGTTGVVGTLKVGKGARNLGIHTSRYDFNDDNLTVGSAYWVRLVERFLEQEET